LRAKNSPQPIPSKNPSLEICRRYHSCENMFFSMENLLEKPGVRNYIKKDQIFKALGVGRGEGFGSSFHNEGFIIG
jgi:hypothetical protein